MRSRRSTACAHPQSRTLFTNAAFRRAWLAGTFPHLGYWVLVVTFQGLVADATDRDPLSLGLLYFAMLAPFLIVSLPAGAWADRFDRRLVLVICHATIGVTSAVTATLVFLEIATPAALMVTGVVFGTALAIGQPSAHALVAQAVSPSEISRAVTLQGLGITASRFFGPACAGLGLATIGAGGTIVGHALISALVVVAALRIRDTRAATSRSTHRIVGQIVEGARHAFERPPVLLGLGTVAVVSLLGSSYMAQVAATAALVTDDEQWFVVLVSATGVGALAGVALLSAPLRRTPSARLLLVASLLGLALSIALMAVARSLGLQLAAFTFAAAFQFVALTGSVRLIQVGVEDSHRGRVMSLHQLCFGGMIPVGGIVLGVTWARWGPGPAFGLHAALIASFACVVATLTYGRRRITTPGASKALSAGDADGGGASD